MQVSLWMTPAPQCVHPDAMLGDVAGKMEHGAFRQVPVVDADGRLIGIITQRDLREHKGYLDVTRVSGAMTEPAIAVSPEDSLETAAQILLERKIGGVPVTDAKRHVVGILTTSDLMRGLLDGLGATSGAVRVDVQLDVKHALADVVRVLEAAGITVLSLGTYANAEGASRRFYVRVPAAAVERAGAALRAAGLIAPVVTAA